MVLLVQPSSAAAKIVFLIQKFSLCEQQNSSLKTIIQVTLVADVTLQLSLTQKINHSFIVPQTCPIVF